MQQKQLISSGAIWEDLVGYSRAVKVGNLVEISGTTAVDGKNIIGKGDIYSQAVFIFKKIESVLLEAGGGIQNVIRTRMYVTDISKWEEIAKAHSLFFKEIKPATTMVEVSRLIDNELLIEIEVSASNLILMIFQPGIHERYLI